MLSKKHRVIIAIAFFVLHLILQGISLLYGFAVGMQEFDKLDGKLPEREPLLGYKYAMVPFYILSFPTFYTPITGLTFPPSLVWQYLPFVFNSLIWSIAFYLLSIYITQRRQKQQQRKKT